MIKGLETAKRVAKRMTLSGHGCHLHGCCAEGAAAGVPRLVAVGYLETQDKMPLKRLEKPVDGLQFGIIRPRPQLYSDSILSLFYGQGGVLKLPARLLRGSPRERRTRPRSTGRGIIRGLRGPT